MTMLTNAEILVAKGAHLEEEAEAEAEAKQQEEDERQKREAEAAEEARKQKEIEEFTQKECEMLKECKRQFEVKKKRDVEAGKGQKRDRDGLEGGKIIGAMIKVEGVLWKTKEGQLQGWKEDMCSNVGGWSIEKRKVENKGKGKVMRTEGSELGVGSGAALLAEMWGLKEGMDRLWAEFCPMADIGRAIVKLLKLTNVGFITYQMDLENGFVELEVGEVMIRSQ
ncbi:hypothetical protein PILCRDRAFT_10033 [Piloderma croceum F 1598]|uniref:Uncharacterized protein n=1 Tax=Piloderma croceum (strain F 1598) TaxID=765440 RepID=A0A0C3FK24_PILCF|nr:hypothetical protein PILCRDRAFT_10033 [Piloderma croceum F 1598]